MTDYIMVKKYRKGRAGIAYCIYNGKNEGRRMSALTKIPIHLRRYFIEEEDLSIIFVKEYDMKTHIKGYHAYMTKWTKWTPKNGEILKARPEPENEYDKYAVAVERCGDVVGHLSKGRSARFAKTVSYFLCASNENCCRV